MARILIAEDYEDLRELISDLLRKDDHSVDACEDGALAQQTLKQKQFDLIILDWELPKIFGIDICKQYRSSGGTTPILMLTGKKAVADKEAEFDAGADDYLTKPFHPKELSARVKALLRRATPQTTTPATDALAGRIFADKYEMISTLGRGGSSVIYKARHTFLDRLLAVKVMHAQLTCDLETMARFRQEAQAVSQLNHKNIVAVHDFGFSSEGLPYIVMDIWEGTTLAEMIQDSKGLDPQLAVKIAVDICQALVHCHEQGIIHRDVKPTNILWASNSDHDQRNAARLTDFGIAKVLSESAGPQITQSGDVVGSPLFMSPEQCMGKGIDERTDVYSLGCVLYTALMGREPFIGENLMDTMYKRTVESAPRFSEVRPTLNLPGALEELVFKAIAKDPSDRFQNMSELLVALERIEFI